jgi:acyl carrier protein phosphodiesterase
VNYLAHAYLSFREPEILVGNLISDFVKGKKKFSYSDIIQKGITLHRMIDEFTDHHQATMQAKVFFKPDFGLYSGAFVDIIYDYFLANDKNEFPESELAAFAGFTYKQLNSYETVFPDKFQRMFYYMQRQNWLYNYQFKEGIYNSFDGLVRRAKYMTDHQKAFSIFEDHLAELKNCYEIFFPDIKAFSLEQLGLLVKKDESPH